MNNQFKTLIKLAKEFNTSTIDESTESVDKLLSIYEDLKLKQENSVWYQYKPLIIDLLHSCGLFPYLTENFADLSLSQALALASYQLDENCYLHHGQIEARRRMFDPNIRHLAIAAPTSFGKTRLLDLYIEEKKPNKVVIIQPTHALIQETYSRLRKSFSSQGYNVFFEEDRFNPECQKWVAILTQERCLSLLDTFITEKLDLFVVDEFYNIDPNRSLKEDEREDVSDERAIILQTVYKGLVRFAEKTLMLGPHADKVSDDDIEFYKTSYSPVRQSIEHSYKIWSTKLKEKTIQQNDKLISILKQKEPTLIYRSSPTQVQNLARDLINSKFLNDFIPSKELKLILEWLGFRKDLSQELKFFYPQHKHWVIFKALQKGVGIHHGQMPKSLHKIIVWLFNNKHIHTIIMTNTLTQGVNTVAKNLVYWKGTHEKTIPVDYFSYTNIIGRAGRLNEYITGSIYLFVEPPKKVDVEITVPVIIETDGSDEYESLQNNSIDTEDSNTLQRLQKDFPSFAPDKFEELGEFIKEHLNTIKNIPTLISSSEQEDKKNLNAFFANRIGESNLITNKSIQAGLNGIVAKKTEPQEVDNAYARYFQKLYTFNSFKLPNEMNKIIKLARYNNDITEEEAKSISNSVSYYARVRTPSPIYTLEEVGIPFQLSLSVYNSNKNKFHDFQSPTIEELIKVLREYQQSSEATEPEKFIIEHFLPEDM